MAARRRNAPDHIGPPFNNLAIRSDLTLAQQISGATWLDTRRQGQRVVFARNLLDNLRRRELDDVTGKMAAETGLVYRSSAEGEHVAGIISCRPGFFLPVAVLSRLFRRLFLEGLQKAFNAGDC